MTKTKSTTTVQLVDVPVRVEVRYDSPDDADEWPRAVD